MNSDATLEEAILDSELRHINFFNGRLLTGGDLEAEQSAQHGHFRQLGRASGAGVVCGLEVAPANDSSAEAPILVITKGMALNLAGQTLRMECDQRLTLIPSVAPGEADECVFTDCDPEAAGATLASGTGFYLLVIAPSSRSEGKAPVSGLGNALALCNSGYLTEGVKFRFLRLNVSGGTDANKLRNVVAYQCFAFANEPSNDAVGGALNQAQPAAAGLETLVPAGYLTTNDVPLAIIEWNTTGLGFIDQWAVRRRVARPTSTLAWPPLIGDSPQAENEARLLQFQDHVKSLVNPAAVQAQLSFRYLPPVGLVPLANQFFPQGFDPDSFFAGLKVRGPCFIEGAQLESLLRLALHYPAIDLESESVIWLYRIRENSQALDQGNPGLDYVIFASGQIPPRSTARFDVSRWSYSNYTIL